MVRFPGSGTEGRAYAGSFELSPAPQAPHSPAPSARATRARRGSDVIFTTDLASYAAGVLAAEDARIAGEPRAALLAAIAHNASSTERHGGRPPCDTTHCQVFLGTSGTQPRDAHTLEGRDPLPEGWALFSRGGDEPWRELRTAEQVTAALGGPPLSFRFESRRFIAQLQRDGAGGERSDRQLRGPCERLRALLRLPSCPLTASVRSEGVWFTGRGAGHGLGLDVEAAKRSGAPRAELLRGIVAKGRAKGGAHAPPDW